MAQDIYLSEGKLVGPEGHIDVSALADSGTTALGTMPVVSAGVTGLTTSLSTIGASWWRLAAADWGLPAASLQYRVRVIGQGLTSGDVLGAQLYDADAAAAMFAEFTGTADGDSSTAAVSGWQSFPASPASGYVQVRNQTAARGTLPMVCIDVRAL